MLSGILAIIVIIAAFGILFIDYKSRAQMR